MAPGPLLGGHGQAVGVGFSGGVYYGGGGAGEGEGRGGSSRDPGGSSSEGGEDMAAGRTGGGEGSGRAFIRSGEARRGGDTGRSGRGCSRGGEATGGGEGRGCEYRRGGYNIRADEQKHQKKKYNEEKSDFSAISLDYLVSTPSLSRHRVNLPSMSFPGTGNCKTMSSMSKTRHRTAALEATNRTSSTKRKLQLLYDGDGAFSELPYHQQFHDLFVCSHDLGIPLGTLAYYAANNRMVDLEIPAGDLYAQNFVSPTDDTRVLIGRSAQILEQLHENDRSLAGRYDFTNFTVYKKKRVKLNDIKPGSLVRLKTGNSDADYSTFALELHQHSSNSIPSELKGWFCLLLEEPTSQEHLIAHSISLMEATRAIFYFSYIYGELQAFKQNSPIDYKDVIDFLDERHGNWKKRAKLNTFTKEVLEYRDPKTRKVAIYGDDAGELLRLCRNLVTHILGKTLSIQLCLKHKHILAIINSVFPGLLFNFQVAMLKTRSAARLTEF